jgi:tetratricopeptide (TPR) repeat protein
VAACSGSVQRLLGCLAATLSRFDDAAAHFEAAIEVNAGIRARPWVAHTQLGYARMLLALEPADSAKARELLSEALDTAEQLGMTALTGRAQALRLQADAVATG